MTLPLRSQLIRLAHENPELRSSLLPLVHTAASGPVWPPVEGSPEAVWKAWVGPRNLKKFQVTAAAVAEQIKAALAVVPGAVQFRLNSLYQTSLQGEFLLDGHGLMQTQVWCGTTHVGREAYLLPPRYSLLYGYVRLDSTRPDLKNVMGDVTRLLIPEVVDRWTKLGYLKKYTGPDAGDIRSFIKGLRTWFREDSDSDDQHLFYSTRAHRGADSDDPYQAGRPDLEEARRLQKAVESEFGSAVEARYSYDQEWVFFSVRLISGAKP